MLYGWTLLTELPEWAYVVCVGLAAIALARMLRPACQGDA
jgi:hypothetical protein